MTRETKIGLLVGLAFIIVIGILLSDHVKSTTEPIAAALPQAADNVRASVSAPGAEETISYNRDTVVSPSQPITPRQPVPTQNELTPQRTPESIVQVGGPSNPRSPVAIQQSSRSPVNVTAGPITSDNGTTNSGQPGNNSSTDAPGRVTGALGSTAQAHGETLVPVGANGEANPAPLAARKYTVESGDTLSRLAARFMGGNTKTNRDAIVKANPSLQQDPDKLIVGHSYVIPAAVAVAASPAPVSPPSATAGDATPAGVYWYTVKSNDSLWSIAADQLGSGAAWTAIKELNKDVLKGADTVHPNMRLRLPAKPVVSASVQ